MSLKFRAKSFLQPALANNALLEMSYAHCSCPRIVIGCLCVELLATETLCPLEPKIFIVQPFTEKVCQPLI